MRYNANRDIEYQDAGIQDQLEVLIVDDDPMVLASCAEIMGLLGYLCITATDASEALRILSRNPRIQVIVADLKMPGMDGLTLLDEISSRFMSHRPLAVIISTAAPSIPTVIQAMHLSAVDLLEKPFGLNDVSMALIRVRTRLRRLASAAPKGPRKASTGLSQTSPAEQKPINLRALAVTVLKARQERAKYFSPEAISDPSWEILVQLAAAGLEKRPVSISALCASSDAPFSTASRHVNQLVESGLVVKVRDSEDRRRHLVELHPDTMELMSQYLRTSWAAMLQARAISELNA